MGRKPFGRKKQGWQARVGRLLKEDEAGAAAEAQEGRKRKRDEEGGGEAGAAEGAEVEETPAAAAKRRKQMYQQENKSAQLFVGNLPFDCTQEDVAERFSAFGKVKRVLLVRDKESGHLIGTGFIHFASESAVEKAISESNAQKALHEMEAGGSAAKGGNVQSKKLLKKLIFKGKALEQNSIGGIPFNGRMLQVNTVVNKGEAQGLTRQAERERVKESVADPRNLKLLEEGRILANTTAAYGLSENRLQLLQQRYQLKKKKLKDPNFFVSDTRLSLRDLPPSADDSQLKKIVSDSVRRFTAEHPEFAPSAEAAIKGNPFIKMMRVVKDPGTNMSRGFAFVEFRQHEVALHVLRDLNNNPNVFGGKRLDVEFAVESVHALQKLQRITDKGRERNKAMREFASQGQDPKEAWRKQQDEKAAKKLADKEKRKKEFEKYKKFQRFSGRKNV